MVDQHAAPAKRPRRALLFMPGDNLRKIEKGAASGVDSVIMDLEDGVALNRKSEARKTVAAALQSVTFGRSERLVRLNPASSHLIHKDLPGTFGGQPDGYVIPKVETAEQVQYISYWLDAAERENGWPQGGTRLIAIVESALGVVNLREIASAEKRLDGLAFGAEDFASSVGATRSTAGTEVLFARSAVVAHAAAFGLQAIDTPYVMLSATEADDPNLAADAAFAAQLGYTGKFAIHPKQIATIERAFQPSEAAIAYARRVLDVNQAQQGDGTGVFELDGKMIDMPMVRAAQTVIMRARAAGLISSES